VQQQTPNTNTNSLLGHLGAQNLNPHRLTNSHFFYNSPLVTPSGSKQVPSALNAVVNGHRKQSLTDHDVEEMIGVQNKPSAAAGVDPV